MPENDPLMISYHIAAQDLLLRIAKKVRHAIGDYSSNPAVDEAFERLASGLENEAMTEPTVDPYAGLPSPAVLHECVAALKELDEGYNFDRLTSRVVEAAKLLRTKG